MNTSDLAALLATLRAGGVKSCSLGPDGSPTSLELHPIVAEAPPQRVPDAEDVALKAIMDLAGKSELP